MWGKGAWSGQGIQLRVQCLHFSHTSSQTEMPLHLTEEPADLHVHVHIIYIYMYMYIINPRRACAARVTVVVLCVCLSVCLFVTHYSRTTGYEAAYERYQQIQCYKGRKNNVAILLKRLRSRDMA